ncbi:hypothetical protein MJO28_010306 [Puccinia striiformis f. sp. tritici]|uniref:Uncharacterized protein n=1 Tax=Puccinia striiformis f. sp. tritici TaxID=168172 RepID=A0ACC0E5F1_9BASI|nr:hypothetical protein MJO28_010306 [Puccinia striiformis f. sp. tritici]
MAARNRSSSTSIVNTRPNFGRSSPRCVTSTFKSLAYIVAFISFHPLAIDLMVVKEIKCLNIVPAIAQSDRLTLEECEAFKVRIRDELSYHSIRLYPFDNEDQDTEELRPNEAIRVSNLLLQPQSSCPKE